MAASVMLRTQKRRLTENLLNHLSNEEEKEEESLEEREI